MKTLTIIIDTKIMPVLLFFHFHNNDNHKTNTENKIISTERNLPLKMMQHDTIEH